MFFLKTSKIMISNCQWVPACVRGSYTLHKNQLSNPFSIGQVVLASSHDILGDILVFLALVSRDGRPGWNNYDFSTQKLKPHNLARDRAW